MRTYNYETIKSNRDIFNPFYPTILIAWVNSNHYELLMPHNLSEYPIEKKITELNKFQSTNNKEKHNNYKKKGNNILENNCNKHEYKYNETIINKINNREKDKNIKEDNILTEKYKKELTSFVKNNDSIYPIINGCKNGNTRLQDIYNYLKSGLENNTKSKKKIWQNLLKMLKIIIKK